MLWAGLALLVVQWSLFLRLTFWELSWDVMEPISYFFSSLWGILAYCYFLVRAQQTLGVVGRFWNISKSPLKAESSRIHLSTLYPCDSSAYRIAACPLQADEAVASGTDVESCLG